jgi:signal transduction histidine kinase
MADGEVRQFSIFCDFEGKVTEILQDDNHLLQTSLVGSLLFSIVVPGDLDKILNFFLELRRKKTAIGWEINISTPAGAETFSFFGGIFDDQIGIDVIISVTDQGQGIPEAELVKLFKPFSRTSVQSTAGEVSTGLGLSIARNLILGHKGKIWVESTVGKGSTFYFSLPV